MQCRRQDAHCHNDLMLLERSKAKTIILGVVDIARTAIEPVEEILLAATRSFGAHRQGPGSCQRLTAASSCSRDRPFLQNSGTLPQRRAACDG